MRIIPIQTGKIFPFPKMPLVAWVEISLRRQRELLRNSDILVLSSKIVSYFEGNIIDLSSVKISARAKTWAQRMDTDQALVQLAIDEADEIIDITPWVLLTRKNGIFCANAGVDLSNVPKGYAISWPKGPFDSAKKIRYELMKRYQVKRFAILIIDSACQPGRKGTTAYAIGHAGLKGYLDLKGKKDLYGNVLRYSALNIVDSLATAANVLMGESKERMPMAIIRDFPFKVSKKTKRDEMVISSRDEMFPIRSPAP